MDTYTFIVKMVEAIIWPLTICCSLLLLKQPLSTLLPLLQNLKYKDIEINFSKEVKELSQELDEELPKESSELLVTPKVIKLAELSPRAAVLEAWINVEFSANEALQRNSSGLEIQDKSSPQVVIRTLCKKELIQQTTVNMFNNLRALRNHALHDIDQGDFDADAAINYADMCARLVSEFDKI